MSDHHVTAILRIARPSRRAIHPAYAPPEASGDVGGTASQ